jgi:hypothetical protein
MKNLRVKVFTASSKEDLEIRMNRFLTTIPESFLRDLGYSFSFDKNGKAFYSAMIICEKRHDPNKG